MRGDPTPGVPALYVQVVNKSDWSPSGRDGNLFEAKLTQIAIFVPSTGKTLSFLQPE